MSIAIDHVGTLEGRLGRWSGYYARTTARKVDSISSCHAISQLLPGLALVALDIVGRGVQTIRPSFPGTAHRVSLTAGLWNQAGTRQAAKSITNANQSRITRQLVSVHQSRCLRRRFSDLIRRVP